jgi:hypothetical protein
MFDPLAFVRGALKQLFIQPLSGLENAVIVIRGLHPRLFILNPSGVGCGRFV